jgi:hypothetical protein
MTANQLDDRHKRLDGPQRHGGLFRRWIILGCLMLFLAGCGGQPDKGVAEPTSLTPLPDATKRIEVRDNALWTSKMLNKDG